MVKPSDEVTLGEVYRAVQALDARMAAMNDEMRQEAHSVRNKLGAQGTAIALTELKVTEMGRELVGLKDERQTHAGWIIGFLLAGATGIAEYLVHRFSR
jgi:hypothetical protein